MVLFDEASQIVPEDAIGSIYRGKTLVVAGDNKQLPPTSFLQKNLIDDVDWDELSDEDVEVFDSVLDECLGIGLPVKTLKWHYRSRHEDLIAFSNHRFYDDTLITFPAAKAQTDTLGVEDHSTFQTAPMTVEAKETTLTKQKKLQTLFSSTFVSIQRKPLAL